jgi:hypothetical protein
MAFMAITTIAGTIGGFILGKRMGHKKAMSESSVGFD